MATIYSIRRGLRIGAFRYSGRIWVPPMVYRIWILIVTEKNQFIHKDLSGNFSRDFGMRFGYSDKKQENPLEGKKRD